MTFMMIFQQKMILRTELPCLHLSLLNQQDLQVLVLASSHNILLHRIIIIIIKYAELTMGYALSISYILYST